LRVIDEGQSVFRPEAVRHGQDDVRSMEVNYHMMVNDASPDKNQVVFS